MCVDTFEIIYIDIRYMSYKLSINSFILQKFGWKSWMRTLCFCWFFFLPLPKDRRLHTKIVWDCSHFYISLFLYRNIFFFGNFQFLLQSDDNKQTPPSKFFSVWSVNNRHQAWEDYKRMNKRKKYVLLIANELKEEGREFFFCLWNSAFCDVVCLLNIARTNN